MHPRLHECDPGYLCSERLRSELRLLESLQQGPAWSDLPVLVHWREFPDAITSRQRWVLAELALRDQTELESPVQTEVPTAWSDLAGSDNLPDAAERPGRIPVPRQPQVLWAQHKYSIMARSYQAYRSLGRQVTEGAFDLVGLWRVLNQHLRAAPEQGSLRNALQHLWGYLPAEVRVQPPSQNRALLQTIWSFCDRGQNSYLWASTALDDLFRFV